MNTTEEGSSKGLRVWSYTLVPLSTTGSRGSREVMILIQSQPQRGKKSFNISCKIPQGMLSKWILLLNSLP